MYGTRGNAVPKVAVKRMSFGVHKGECFGFLGINGAGKTTTLKMLTGDILLSFGTAEMDGLDLLDDSHLIRHKIGYCPQYDAQMPTLTAREHLCLFARIKYVSHLFIMSLLWYIWCYNTLQHTKVWVIATDSRTPENFLYSPLVIDVGFAESFMGR